MGNRAHFAKLNRHGNISLSVYFVIQGKARLFQFSVEAIFFFDLVRTSLSFLLFILCLLINSRPLSL